MIKVQLQGIEKVQRLLDPERVDRLIAEANASIQAQAESIIRAAAPTGKTKQTSSRAFARDFVSKKKPGLSGFVIGSKATRMPANPGSRGGSGVRGGKTKYPYPYPRLLEYGPKSAHKGWLKKAGRRVAALLRPELRERLSNMRKGL